MAKGDKLVPKQLLFIEEYLVDQNATKAAIRAGYSARTAGQTGFRMLRKPQIMAAVNKGLSAKQEKINLTSELVITGLVTEARGDGPDTSPSARVSAWSVLAKILGMLVDKVDVKVMSREAAADRLSRLVGIAPEELLR
jgi:phage terminase small subunit